MDTLFKGRCYLLKGGNESKIYWHLNLPTNDSAANIYVLPEKSENALILGIWHHPIKMMRVGRLMYQGGDSIGYFFLEFRLEKRIEIPF